MKRLLFALLLAPLLHAQTLTFGEPFPLANTRYGATVTQPMVVTNGNDFFVFWRSLSNLRAARLVEGEHRAGRHVLAGNLGGNMAVTWTGTHFLVVRWTGFGLAGHLLDANAEPVGGSIPIATDAILGGAASNGETVLVLHWNRESVQVVALTSEGVPTGVSSTVLASGSAVGFNAIASNGSGFAAVISTDSGPIAVTFDRQGRERSRAILFSGTFPRSAHQVAIRSDGRDYLAAWQLWDGTVEAARVRADGSIGPVVTLDVPAPQDRLGARPIGVAWTGANWAVAYTRAGAAGAPLLRVAYLHPTTLHTSGFEDAERGGDPSLATMNGRVLLAWSHSGAEATPPMASFLPLAGREPEPVTFAAADQELKTVASTADTTLVVWGETGHGTGALRAGVRSADGDWTERQLLPEQPRMVVAATDGRDFVVVGRDDHAASAVFLDATSRVTAGPVQLPLRPRTITWTGSDYVIADLGAVARMSRAGTVSPAVSGGELWFLALASNGSAVMALMLEPQDCSILCPTILGVPRFALLGPDLRPIGEPRRIEPSGILEDTAQLVWDGTRFVAAWTAAHKVYVAAIPADGGEATILATFDSTDWRSPRLAAVEGGVAVTWIAGTLSNPDRTRVAVIGHDDSVSTAAIEDGRLRGVPFVAALPNGGVAHLISVPQFAPPHHGSSRVVMRVAGAALPEKPDAPHLTGVVRNGRVELAWTAPPQVVAGYRIEYRIGDGAWNELDRWFDTGDDGITLSWQLRPGVPYQFRIRAINDAGPSDSSAPVLLNVSRRRAVR